MSVVKRNIVANFGGSVWTEIMSLVFVPLYIPFKIEKIMYNSEEGTAHSTERMRTVCRRIPIAAILRL